VRGAAPPRQASTCCPFPPVISVRPVPRAATGTIKEDVWRDGTTVSFRLRIPYKGRKHWVTLGTNLEGWSRERAQVELDGIMERVRRGTWVPPSAQSRSTPPPPDPDDESAPPETIHITLSRWWQRKKTEVGESTQADYSRWRLPHILAFRPHTPTADIDEQWVDELRDHLLAQPAKNRRKGSDKTLSPTSVNKILETLAQGLDLAVRHKVRVGNPARTKGTKLKVKKSRRPWLEPDMVIDLLEVAGDWEAELAKRNRSDQCYGRRELLALLCLAGPRISETLKSDRGEYDLAGGDRWRIPASKTEAGQRDVELTAFLVDELRSHVATSPSRRRPLSSRKPMFPTSNGTRMSQENVRRMIDGVVERTNKRRAAEEKMLLPPVTPHSLRVTYVSLSFMAGRDPAWVMGQVGHRDARLTLEIYTRTMQRKRVDRALVWSLMRFADEPDEWPGFGRNGPAKGPTGVGEASGADARIPRA
jgi:integrase